VFIICDVFYEQVNGLELNQAFSGTSCFSDWRI
jgi:hypothetical protein